MMRANELRWAGAFRTLLDRAGMTKTITCRSWYYERNPNRDASPRWIRNEVVEFAQVVPAWAYQLAADLTRDHDLARKLGYVKRRSLVKSVADLAYVDKHRVTATKGKIWVSVDEAGRIPLDLRVRILRVAAGNAMARELFADDYEAAVLIIRDSL